MIPLRSLKDTLAVITGGSSGIGLATARLLSSKGCRIILVARDEGKLDVASSTIDGVISTESVDVSNWGQVSSMADRIIKEHGRPNLIINSAGIVYPGTLEELSMKQIRSMIDIDLLGTINVCKAFSNRMTLPGHIVNISSMAGLVGIYGYTGYSAAKFGVLGFSEALRMEIKNKGIGVSVVFPPDTETPQLEFENRTKPDDLKNISGTIRPIKPEKVATAILKGIASGDLMIIPGASSKATYHANRLAGPLVRFFMDGMIKDPKEGEEDE